MEFGIWLVFGIFISALIGGGDFPIVFLLYIILTMAYMGFLYPISY